MNALTPEMVHELAELVAAVAVLIKVIWPNGVSR